MSYPIAFDFDGVCCTNVGAPAIGEPIREVLDLIGKLLAAGYRVVIYSHRPMPGSKQAIRKWLGEQGVYIPLHDVHTDKLLYSVFVDDRALEYPRSNADLESAVLGRLT